MDLNELKGTSDDQFSKDISFNAVLPDDGKGIVTDLVLTIKSFRNKSIAPKLQALFPKLNAEQQKLEKGNLTPEAQEKVVQRAEEIEAEIAKLVLVSFEGLTEKGKPVEVTEASIDDLIKNYGWIRDNIVKKSTSQQAFYNLKQSNS